MSGVREKSLVISDECSSQTASDKLLWAIDGGNWSEDTKKKTPPKKGNYTYETHEINSLTQQNQSKGSTHTPNTTTTKMAKINNYWLLKSLNIKGFNSPNKKDTG